MTHGIRCDGLKKLAGITAGMAAFTLVMLGSDARAGGIEGTWLSQSGDTQVRIAPCGGSPCGTIMWLKEPLPDSNNPDPAKRGRALIGVQMISGLSPAEGDRWNGQLYNFETGKTYSGSLEPIGNDKLKLSGCVLGGMLCRNQVWTRVK
ncbi:DUF2147 domain-containing protein [Ancylobacter sp. G4_0304]|uniref:DUF2147 domain-containing protein n=1 Tax=Ancylobacter novellus TaxID=921 RepID=A0A2W5R3E5_ANCNO|nr:MAG: DUF2147 domain-containing protein [Ancylobacter novellus]